MTKLTLLTEIQSLLEMLSLVDLEVFAEFERTNLMKNSLSLVLVGCNSVEMDTHLHLGIVIIPTF